MAQSQSRNVELGPTGETLRFNIRAARRGRGWRLSELSDALGQLDYPMSKATLSQVENGQRRVHADELFYFARALGTNVNALLLPPVFSDEDYEVELTAFGWVTAERLQQWLDGIEPLAVATMPGLTAEDAATMTRIAFQSSVKTRGFFRVDEGLPPNVRGSAADAWTDELATADSELAVLIDGHVSPIYRNSRRDLD